MIRLFLLCCFAAALLLAACRRNLRDHYVPVMNEMQVLDSLLGAGEDSSRLAGFFTRWNLQIPPNSSRHQRQNDTLKALYEVYEAYCMDSSIRHRPDSWHDRAANSACFLAHPGILYYKVSPLPDSMAGNLNIRDSLPFFRPPMHLYARRNIYLMPELREALNIYSGRNDPQIKGVMFIPSGDTALVQKWEVYKKRRMALRRVVAWHSDPKVDLIMLSGSLKLAHVHLGYFGSGTYLKFVKNGQRWVFAGAFDTWIE